MISLMMIGFQTGLLLLGSVLGGIGILMLIATAKTWHRYWEFQRASAFWKGVHEADNLVLAEIDSMQARGLITLEQADDARQAIHAVRSATPSAPIDDGG